MTVGLQYQQLRSALEKIYPADEATAIASVVIEYHTGISRFQLPLRKNETLIQTINEVIQQNLASLLKHQPLQYVINEAWFYGLRLYVDASVLIPRPETEELVHEAIQYIRNIHEKRETIKLLDIGTGSGCIAIAIKKECAYVQVKSIDISNEALQVARKNALENGTDIQFEQVDFLDESLWPAVENYDVIISNPPYITLQERDTLDKHVKDWEPGSALFVPDDDPLLFYRKICRFAESRLNADGMLFLECHFQYAGKTRDLFAAAGYSTTLKNDMNGNARMLLAQKTAPINR